MSVAPEAGKALPPHRVINPSVLYVGTPVALITTTNRDGSPNISPISSAWALGDRVILGMSSGGLGTENAVREGQCVINFPSADLWENIERIARTTGRNPVPEYKVAMGYHHDPKKFETAGLTPLPSDIVSAPRIGECPLQFEAKIVTAHAPGGGTWEIGGGHSFAIIEAQVVRVHAHEGVTVEGTNHIDVERWQPLLYVFRHYFGTGEDLGRNFRAEI